MTKAEIQKFKSEHTSSFRYDLIDDDAIMRGGRYEGMKLSDIYVIFPEYLDFVINFDRADKAIKMIAKEIKRNAEEFEESITAEIALNG